MPDGYLTTHVLDTALGQPARALDVTLYRLEGEARVKLAEMQTNADGRTDTPILPREGFAAGTYELVFAAGAYLDRIGSPAEDPVSSRTSRSASAFRMRRRITMCRFCCRPLVIQPTGAAEPRCRCGPTSAVTARIRPDTVAIIPAAETLSCSPIHSGPYPAST